MKSFFLISLIILSITNLFSQYQFSDIYEENPDVPNCEAGILLESEKQKVLQAINALRAIHGLKPVTYDYSKDAAAQNGALISAANSQLSHTPDQSWECWTQAGYDGNENSNLYWTTFGSPSFLPDSYVSILGWMIDENVPNLGHRRAIINPFIDKIAFGRVDGYSKKNSQLFNIGMNLYYRSSYNNTYSSNELEYVAYPQGNYPIELVDKSWYLSFHAIYDTQRWFNNSNVDYSSAEVIVSSENGELSVSDISSDNQGWGSLPNQIKWRVSGLQDYVEYTVQINNVNVNGTMKNYEYTFTLGGTDSEAPQAPTLSYPDSKAEDLPNTFTMDWDDVSNAEVYSLHVSDNMNFNNLIVEENTLENSEYEISDLNSGITYYWRVSATNLAGNSGWSEVRSFSTEIATPNPPGLLLPINEEEVEVFEPQFSWQYDDDFSSFTLIIATNSSFTRNGTVLEQDVEGTEYTIDNSLLNPNETYYWKVKTNNGNKESQWTANRVFTTPDLPTEPSNLSPITGMTYDEGDEIIFSWDEIDREFVDYRIQISENENLSNAIIDSVLELNSFNYQTENGKPLLFWRVRSEITGKGSSWSNVNSINVWPTSIDNRILNDLNLVIYSNPVKDILSISFNNSDILSISLTDLNGKNIFKENNLLPTHNEISINVNELSSGSYLLVLEHKVGNITEIIIKE